MEVRSRRLRMVQPQDQENAQVIKGKANNVPVKRQGLGVRGALGELTNSQSQCTGSAGKVAFAAADIEKKIAGCRVKSFSHVQSKVDTGLACRVVQPSSRPPLRREESTASLTARATARYKATLKESTKVLEKENLGVTIPTKKADSKKPNKLAAIKENRLASAPTTLKPILKEPTDSLGKLKIDDKAPLINLAKLNKHATLPKEARKIKDIDTSPKLPSDIEDIDATDSETVFLMTHYIKDIYRYLRELEVKYPIERDYLKRQNDITPNMRATLIDWLIEVHGEFKQQQETLQLTVAIIDRYLQVAPNVQRNRLQLIGVTALFIAGKYEEVYTPDISEFIYITAKAYTKVELFQCEQDILQKLGFSLARPLQIAFLRRFVKAARGDTTKYNLAKYFIELCLMDYSMVHYKPSELAAAALCLSLHLLTNKSLDNVWTPTVTYYSGYGVETLKPIVRQIAKIVANVEKSKYKSVYNKYLCKNKSKVSSLPELKGAALRQLAGLTPNVPVLRRIEDFD